MTRAGAKTAGRKLLGDRIAAVLDALGARPVTTAIERMTGKPCGCAERTAALNRWDAARRLRG